MKPKLFLILMLLGISVIALSACGFKLRGAQKFPPEYKYALIQGTAEFSSLGKILKQYLGAAGLKTVSNVAEADMVLIVRRDKFKRRVLSVNTAGSVNEYEISYNLSINVNDRQGTVLVNNMKISLIRDYTFDPDNVLAKSDEEIAIKRQMQQLAVRQAFRQLSVRLSRWEKDRQLNEKPGSEIKQEEKSAEQLNQSDSKTSN